MGRKQVIGVILLSGCACPELTAVPIEDPDGLMAEGQADGIRDALADFAAWTGGPAVCFPSVRITADEDLEGALGRWDGAGRPMRLAGDHPRAYATVVHELCHAWDEGVGHESDWHPTIFPEESVRDRQTYDAPVLRVREAFARVCEGGPADLRLREDLADRCGIQTSDEGERWVAREVYGVALPEPVVAPLDLVRTPLDAALGGLRVLDAVSGGGRVWLLGMRARPFHPLQPLRVYHVLLGLDARSGAVETRLMLRRRPESRRRFRLVGGEPAPLLVEDGPDGMLLSALGPDGRPDTLLRLEPGMLQWDGAARVGSEVWMTGVDAVAEDGLSVLDLVSGALGPAALDPPLPAWRTVFGQVSWTPAGEVLAGGFTERLGAGLLRIDPGQGTWTAWPLPDGAEAGRVAGLPDGRAVVPASLWAGEHKLRMLAVVGSEQALQVAEGCEASRVAGGLRFLPLADGLWFYEDATGADGVAHGRYLTRVRP